MFTRSQPSDYLVQSSSLDIRKAWHKKQGIPFRRKNRVIFLWKFRPGNMSLPNLGGAAETTHGSSD